MVFEGASTNFMVTDVLAIEVFKGAVEPGATFTIAGIGVHENPQPNSEHLLMLRYQDGSHFQEPARRHLFENYPAVHNWFCALERNAKDEDRIDLVMYDMITSEGKGPNYLVNGRSTFEFLRKLREGSAD